jgi:ABC-type Zn uptake system ZnuABC Zn-binding protein ZnuA
LCVTAHADPIRVVTTIPDLAEFAKRVGGDKVEVSSLSSGEENPHNVLMSPSMVTRLAKADLFIQMGLGFEHAYAPALLAESRNQKIQAGKSGFLDTSGDIRVREVPKSLDRTEGDVHPMGNPHYNLDPEYARRMVKAIAQKLSEMDPANRAFFETNAKNYDAALEKKIREWKATLGGKGIKFISYHPHWVYFAERFGLKDVGTIEPKPGVEPGPRHLEDLINRMKSDGVKLILKESFYSDRLPQEIAKRTGARIASVPIMVGGTPQAEDYIMMMDQIVNSVAGKS